MLWRFLMKLIIVWGFLIIFTFFVVADSRVDLCVVPISIRAHVTTAWVDDIFASTGFNYALRALCGQFSFDKLVILILGVVILGWAFCLDDTATGLLTFKVVRKACTLRSWLVICILILLTLARNTRQLLLWVATPSLTNESWWLAIISCLLSTLSSSYKSDLLILVLIVLYRQFRLWSINLITFLTHTLRWNIMLFSFLSAIICWNLQMSINEGWGKFIFGDSRGQQFWDSSAQKVFLENFTHRRAFCGIFRKHIC